MNKLFNTGPQLKITRGTFRAVAHVHPIDLTPVRPWRLYTHASLQLWPTDN